VHFDGRTDRACASPRILYSGMDVFRSGREASVGVAGVINVTALKVARIRSMTATIGLKAAMA